MLAPDVPFKNYFGELIKKNKSFIFFFNPML